MGLFMVKMQVESLDGNISIKSELNKGTEFLLEFPLPDPEVVPR
jgi:chemotaxis protein histidine kinase CheA